MKLPKPFQSVVGRRLLRAIPVLCGAAYAVYVYSVMQDLLGGCVLLTYEEWLHRPGGGQCTTYSKFDYLMQTYAMPAAGTAITVLLTVMMLILLTALVLHVWGVDHCTNSHCRCANHEVERRRDTVGASTALLAAAITMFVIQ